MPLTHFDIQNTKPKAKPYKLADGGGLFLLVQPNGSKLWRLKYRHLGTERALSFGAYPTMSLAEARTKRDEAKKLIGEGVDPSVRTKLARIAAETAARSTFGLVAAEFLSRRTEQRPPLWQRTSGCWKTWRRRSRIARSPRSRLPKFSIS